MERRWNVILVAAITALPVIVFIGRVIRSEYGDSNPPAVLVGHIFMSLFLLALFWPSSSEALHGDRDTGPAVGVVAASAVTAHLIVWIGSTATNASWFILFAYPVSALSSYLYLRRTPPEVH